MRDSKTKSHSYFDSKGLMNALEEVSVERRGRFAVRVRNTARKSIKPAPQAVEVTLSDFLPGPLKALAHLPLFQLIGAAQNTGIPPKVIFSAINLFKKTKNKKRQIPSKPGTPPHKQSGKLRKGIIAQVDEEKDDVRVALAPDAWYGRVHEVGSRKHPKRPFLLPALQKHIDKLPDEFKGADLSKTKAGKKMNRRRRPINVDV